MKILHSSNRGATLIELISSIAIFSILGISCFTLLMFSIRTNNTILEETAACRDAEVLNERLGVLLKDAIVVVEDDFDFENGPIQTINIRILNSEDEYETLSLKFDGGTLMQGDSVLQDDVTDCSFQLFSKETNLIRIQYIINDTYTCSKLFLIAGFGDSVSVQS